MDVFAVEAGEFASGQAHTFVSSNLKQEIQYCRAPDGVLLASAKVRPGRPFGEERLLVHP